MLTDIHTAEERMFVTGDGTRLSYCESRRIEPGHRGRALLVVSATSEEEKLLTALVDEMRLPETRVFTWSAAAAERCGLPALEMQLDALTRHLVHEYATAASDVAVIAGALGAAVVAAWAHDYAPPVRCLVLVSPRLAPGEPDVSVPVDVSAGWRRAIRRVVADARAIATPLALVGVDSDGEAEQRRIDELFARLGSENKERHIVQRSGGDDQVRSHMAALARTFLLRAFDEPPRRPSLLDADRTGYTKEEFDALRRPLPLLSTRRLQFAMGNVLMRTVGRLSRGIRLGLATGFDSGSTMDYVYRCRPSGLTRWGKRLDADYLDSIGWRAIRVRRRHLQQAIVRAAGELQAQGLPVVLVDIAAGLGRYIMEVATDLQPRPARVLLRDYSEIDVHEGRKLLAEYGLGDIAAFEQADAFDRDSLAAIVPRPTLAVVCGLYELFPENDPVRASLAGLADAMPPGSVLVYTGLPWHPEHEFISRVLPSHRRGHRCLTRRRTQAELDELVDRAGFTKTSQAIDEWGIFTVSTATRRDLLSDRGHPL